MGEVNITINGRLFKLGCDDGEEEHLLVLAEHLGKHVDNLRNSIGQAGDEQLYLMAGLMVCDELWEARDVLINTRAMLKNQASTKEQETVQAQQGRSEVAQPTQNHSQQAAIPPVPSARNISADPKAMPSPLAKPAQTNGPVPLGAPAPITASAPAASPAVGIPRAVRPDSR